MWNTSIQSHIPILDWRSYQNISVQCNYELLNFEELYIKDRKWHSFCAIFTRARHCVKSVRIRRFSGPHFAAFGLNAGRYSVSLRIQSQYGETWTRKTPNTDIFHAVRCAIELLIYIILHILYTYTYICICICIILFYKFLHLECMVQICS